MRPDNFSSSVHGRAAVVITGQLYDRRALDNTALAPLITSLHRLQSLTSTSPRIREILTHDGGLERLMDIVEQYSEQQTSPSGPFKPFYSLPSASLVDVPPSDSEIFDLSIDKPPSLSPGLWLPQPDNSRRMSVWAWTLAFQCICNIGVRGTEKVRERLVEGGVLPLVVCVMEQYLQGMDSGSGNQSSADGLSKSFKRNRFRPVPSFQILSTAVSMHYAADASENSSREDVSRIPTPETVSSLSDDDALVHDAYDDAELPCDVVEEDSTSTRTATTDSSSLLSVHNPLFHRIIRRAPTPSFQKVKCDDIQRKLDRDGDVMMGYVDESAARSKLQHPSPRRSRNVSLSPLVNSIAESSPPSKIAEAKTFERISIPSADRLREDTMLSPYLPPLVHPHSNAFTVRDDEILLSLQLLAYLSKYPHVRAAFHRPSPNAPSDSSAPSNAVRVRQRFAKTRSADWQCPNVFSIVEKFTWKPMKDDRSNVRFPPEIQLWAGVIMRNACRKDEGRGGIRQCANMACGKWETSPREFAKCRRCRKAKYCSKICQSKAWSQGHRMWCATNDNGLLELPQNGDKDFSPPDGALSRTDGGIAHPSPSNTDRAHRRRRHRHYQSSLQHSSSSAESSSHQTQHHVDYVAST